MLKNYGEIYSRQDIMTKRLCFSAAIVTFNPIPMISSVNSPKSKPIMLSKFTKEQLIEIEEYAKSYTENPYVIEADGEIYVVIPSIYPTSTFVLLLRMDMKPNVFLRLVKESEGLFVISKNITTAPARMSKRLDAQKIDFFDFCRDIERTFMCLDRFNLYFDKDEFIDGYCEQLIAISKFLAVPLSSVSVTKNDDSANLKSNFALFTAFCTTIMMLARNEAIDRKISAELNFYGTSVMAKLYFKTDSAIRITNETFLLEFLTSNKKMFFECSDSDGIFGITFEPTFIDWSYLEFKQNRNIELFENDSEREF